MVRFFPLHVHPGQSVAARPVLAPPIELDAGNDSPARPGQQYV